MPDGPAGTLYVVAGPIGNLEDITLRALRVLREAELILAEDTRVTRRLLSHYEIHTPLVSCHAYTQQSRIQTLVERLAAGDDLALVTDAGTPGISDPGDKVVSAAISAGHIVTPIPGPSAVTALVSIAAVPGGRFVFDGFPPRGKSDRHRFFARLRTERRAVVLYESPRRISSTLHELQETLGDRNVLIGRELTKRFEEVYRGTLDCAAQWVSSRLCGEFSLLIYPAAEARTQTDESCTNLDAVLLAALAAGQSPSDAVRAAMTATGIGRRAVYARMLELRRGMQANG